jgi:hypothetical protein
MEQQQQSIPNGGAWAAVLAAGIGCAAFAAAVDLVERYKPVSDWLKTHVYGAAGDLPGKSTIGVLIWVAAWGLLHLLLNRRNVGKGWRVTISVLVVLLLLASLAAVFPPVMELVAKH